MIRLIIYFLLLLTLGSGFVWLANHPETIIVTISDTRIVFSLLTAVSLFFIVLIVALFLWNLVKTIVFFPLFLKTYFSRKRKKRGYDALSAGIIAALSGDSARACAMFQKSRKALPQCEDPLLIMLEAQSKLIAQDHEAAIKIFEKMRNHPETQLLGLKYLFDAARHQGESEAARHYAAEAVSLHPGLEWANCELIEKFAIEKKWDQALILLDRLIKYLPQGHAEQSNITAQYYLSLRVVLLTGQAQFLYETDPLAARAVALKAHKLQPDFVPAAKIAAQILFDLQETRKASKLIETLWKQEPHPDLGLVYVNGGSGDSAFGRLGRARQLAKVNAKPHYESHRLLARTALEAGELNFAYKQAQIAAEADPTENSFLLLADIETIKSGDQGKIRYWLAKAVQAQPDKTWIIEGQAVAEWQAVSPVTGHLGRCYWGRIAKQPRMIEEGTGNLTIRRYRQQEDQKPQILAPDKELDMIRGDGLPTAKKEDIYWQGALSCPTFIVDDPGISKDIEKKNGSFEG